MAKTPPKASGQRSIQSIEVGFRLIRLLEDAPTALTLKEISKRAEMPPSKAHLYLVSFRRVGIVLQNPETGMYSLGPYAIQLGLAALRRLDIVSLASKHLEELRDATGEFALLSILGNMGPFIVSKFDSLRPSPMTIQVGYVLPMITTATGRVFLAFMPAKSATLAIAKEKENVNHPFNLDDATIKEILTETRARGMAQTDSLFFSGYSALSAPIFGHDGSIAAAMSITGPSSVIDVNFNGENARILREAAAKVSKLAGQSN